MEHGSTLLRDVVVYLAAAVVLVPLFIRFKLGAVLGYLAAGILIGPAVLGLVGNAEQTLQFAEFGIVLLLFSIGLELSFKRLWAMRFATCSRRRAGRCTASSITTTPVCRFKRLPTAHSCGPKASSLVTIAGPLTLRTH